MIYTEYSCKEKLTWRKVALSAGDIIGVFPIARESGHRNQ